MSKMASLHERGVRNLHDYIEGRKDGRNDIIYLLGKAIENPATAKLPAKMVLQILLASSLELEEDQDE